MKGTADYRTIRLTEPSRAGHRWVGEYASPPAGMPLSIDGSATRYSVTGHRATRSRRRRLGEVSPSLVERGTGGSGNTRPRPQVCLSRSTVPILATR